MVGVFVASCHHLCLQITMSSRALVSRGRPGYNQGHRQLVQGMLAIKATSCA